MEKQAQWALVAAAWVLALGVLGMGAYVIWRFNGASSAMPGTASGATLTPIADRNGVDPVDGKAITPGPDTLHVNYNGVDYYFDDEKDLYGHDHKTLFLMDPLHYLTGSAPLAEPQQLSPTPQALPTSLPNSEGQEKLPANSQTSSQAAPLTFSPSSLSPNAHP